MHCWIHIREVSVFIHCSISCPHCMLVFTRNITITNISSNMNFFHRLLLFKTLPANSPQSSLPLACISTKQLTFLQRSRWLNCKNQTISNTERVHLPFCPLNHELQKTIIMQLSVTFAKQGLDPTWKCFKKLPFQIANQICFLTVGYT